MSDAFNISTIVVLFLFWLINVYQVIVSVPGSIKWFNLFFMPLIMALTAYNLGWLGGK